MSVANNESAVFLTPGQRANILRGVFVGYYSGFPDIVFDSNRRWCANMALLHTLFPAGKVIACVRPVAEIIDSFERLFLKDPTQIPRMLSSSNINLPDRVAELMHPRAVVGFSYAAVRDAYYGPFAQNLLIVEFKDLISNPIKVLEDLHKALNEPWFDYRTAVIHSPPGVEIFDAFIGAPGMHSVQPSIAARPKEIPVVPASLAASLPPSFWLNQSVTTAA